MLRPAGPQRRWDVSAPEPVLRFAHAPRVSRELDGVGSRIKLRSRVYSPDTSDAGPVFIEIKRKDGDYIYKDRTTITREEYAACTDGPFFSPPSLDDPVMREFTRIARGLAMRPAVLVRYHRQALSGKRDKTIRVTFDDHVEALRTDDLFCLEHSPFNALPPGHAVLEIKLSGKLPRWLHRIVVTHDLDRRAISKYLLCVRAASHTTFKLADELPDVHELDWPSRLSAGGGRPGQARRAGASPRRSREPPTSRRASRSAAR